MPAKTKNTDSEATVIFAAESFAPKKANLRLAFESHSAISWSRKYGSAALSRSASTRYQWLAAANIAFKHALGRITASVFTGSGM
mgnify:CR=1 FL=1